MAMGDALPVNGAGQMSHACDAIARAVNLAGRSGEQHER